MYRQDNTRGRLVCHIFDEDVSRPVSSAQVAIIDRRTNQVIEQLTTDTSGVSEEITLEAPPVEYSLEPSEEKPYQEYNVEIQADGFEPVLVEGVQVFSESTAIQEVYLNPEGMRSPMRQEEVLVIPPHRLWGEYPPKIPEEEIKPEPEASGFVVLDRAVVPETIVVHDGRPDNDSAPNYYVPFNDYIKNVASCEIYSTWPDSTIRANIMAIISFTLNRVYTEWYRNRGKNYTITSSTAFDHAFSYGRNIFENLSQIVDEIFANYVALPGIRQPLFTQYCDGKNVTCPNWLTK